MWLRQHLTSFLASNFSQIKNGYLEMMSFVTDKLKDFEIS